MTIVTRKPSRDFGNHLLLITDHGPLITVLPAPCGRGGGVGRNLGVGLGRAGAGLQMNRCQCDR